MNEKIPKTYRVTRRTAKALRLLAVQNDMPVGDLLEAFVKFQELPKHFTRPEHKQIFETVWGQAKLSTKRAGKSGWVENPEPDDVVVYIDENLDEE